MRRRMVVALLATVGLGGSWSFAIAESLAERLSANGPPIVIAHRSAELGGMPENSLAWIGQAIARGVDMVHVNPQLTADGRYVLMHDPTLNRTTDVESVFPEGAPNGPSREARAGKDYVGDYTAAEIGQLHLMDGAGATYPVPMLEEALDLAEGQILVQLGLKSHEVESLAAVLNGRNTENVLLFELYVSGTDQSKLRALSEATGIPVSVTFYQSRDVVKDLNAIAAQLGPRLAMVNVGASKVTPAFLARLEELDVRLAISGWAGAEDMALVDGDPGPWLAALEMSPIALTDRPGALLEALGR